MATSARFIYADSTCETGLPVQYACGDTGDCCLDGWFWVYSCQHCGQETRRCGPFKTKALAARAGKATT